MHQKHDVIDDVWQMNIFITLQVCQNLSNFSYFVAEFYSRPSDENLAAEEEDELPAAHRFKEPRRLRA
jgi:hypothetical protein